MKLIWLQLREVTKKWKMPAIGAPRALYAVAFPLGSQKTRNRSFSRPAGVRPRRECYDRRGPRPSESESTNQPARITQNS